jgi:hypothetical protein
MAIVGATLVNAKAIENALIEAFEKWSREDINEAHWDDQFRDMDRWDWPNETRRKNKQVVDSPRDIYDLGELYDSGVKSYVFAKGRTEVSANWHWDATNSSEQEYAWYVHEGTSKMDGRPFTDDIAVPSSFFSKGPGMAFVGRVQTSLNGLKR